MQTIIGYIILLLVIAIGISVYTISTNLQKKVGWLYLFICVGGVLIGISVGYLRGDYYLGLQAGIIITLLCLFSSVTSRWQRQKFTQLDDWRKKRLKK